MTSDYASCLHMLMKYPPIADMQYFIDMARYLREPNVRLFKTHFRQQTNCPIYSYTQSDRYTC